jgi:tetratricopeptide (TPR) repeat protein
MQKNNLIHTSTHNHDELRKLAVAAFDKKQFRTCARLLEKLLTKEPKNIQLQLDLIKINRKVKNFKKEALLLEALIQSGDDTAAIWNDLGVAWSRAGEISKALESFKQAIKLNPVFEDALYNQGVVLQSNNNYYCAIRSYEQALTINPKFPLALNNRALSYRESGNISAALKAFEEAIEKEGCLPETIWNYALTLLLDGQYEHGWMLYEKRWACSHFSSIKRELPAQQWDGTQNINQKTILLHSEQGLGDSIQFSRYAEMVQGLGATVLLQVQQPLKKIFETLNSVSQVYTMEEKTPDFDFHIPLMSLPNAFRTTLENIPQKSPYLGVNQKKSAIWRAILSKHQGLCIGFVWRGNAAHKKNEKRSLNLAEIIPFLDTKHNWFSLQKDPSPLETEILNPHSHIHDFTSEFNDFEDTAAFCVNLDQIISIDTSIAHLAGAIGVPTQLLLPKVPDFRWLMDKKESPWYEQIRIYRQTIAGDWSAPLRAVFRDLYRGK